MKELKNMTKILKGEKLKTSIFISQMTTCDQPNMEIQ